MANINYLLPMKHQEVWEAMYGDRTPQALIATLDPKEGNQDLLIHARKAPLQQVELPFFTKRQPFHKKPLGKREVIPYKDLPQEEHEKFNRISEAFERGLLSVRVQGNYEFRQKVQTAFDRALETPFGRSTILLMLRSAQKVTAIRPSPVESEYDKKTIFLLNSPDIEETVYVEGPDGKPATKRCPLDVTLIHEIGHALHERCFAADRKEVKNNPLSSKENLEKFENVHEMLAIAKFENPYRMSQGLALRVNHDGGTVPKIVAAPG